MCTDLFVYRYRSLCVRVQTSLVPYLHLRATVILSKVLQTRDEHMNSFQRPGGERYLNEPVLSRSFIEAIEHWIRDVKRHEELIDLPRLHEVDVEEEFMKTFPEREW